MFLKTLTWKGWKKCEYFSSQPVITLIRTESDYPDKKATDLLQVVYQLAKNFQQVATNLSVSSTYLIKLVAPTMAFHLISVFRDSMALK